MSLETAPISDLRKRKQSVGAIQIADKSGEMRTVHLEELTEADRELAERFGYNPVGFPLIEVDLNDLNKLLLGLQTRIWIFGYIFICRQH